MGALRVLVVEDDALLGFFLSEMLAAMGHVVCAIEATEAGAVKAAGQYSPDLMIVDTQLREGNGVSAVDQILKTGPIPHVFISGAKVRAPASGAVIIYKPFREVDLEQAIQLARADAVAV
jgi:DNA-binding response OmpR family regulator